MYLVGNVLSHTRTCEGLWETQTVSYPHCTGQADTIEHLTEVLPTGCLSKPWRSCCDLTGTDITVILHQWTHKETIPGATKPFIYILMKCMSSNGGEHPVMFLLIAGALGDLQEQLWQVFGWTVSSLVVRRVGKRNPVAPGRSCYYLHCLHLTIISLQFGIKSY